jgi:hypothetical protein
MEQERQMSPNVGLTFSDMSSTCRPTHQCRVEIANANIRQTQLSLECPLLWVVGTDFLSPLYLTILIH